MQTHNFRWLTPRRMRALTLAVMSGAAIFSTIGFSGATPPAHHSTPTTPSGGITRTAASR